MRCPKCGASVATVKVEGDLELFLSTRYPQLANFPDLSVISITCKNCGEKLDSFFSEDDLFLLEERLNTILSFKLELSRLISGTKPWYVDPEKEETKLIPMNISPSHS